MLYNKSHDDCGKVVHRPCNSCISSIENLTIRLANSKAGIKPTAPLLVFDKENSIEFSLDSVYYLYMKSNPNPSFCSALPYESLFSYTVTPLENFLWKCNMGYTLYSWISAIQCDIAINTAILPRTPVVREPNSMLELSQLLFV